MVVFEGPGDRAFFFQEMEMATGIVRYYNDAKGFGMITPDLGGPALFALQSAIRSSGVKKLKAAQRVEFDIQNGPQGPCAANIRTLA